MRIVNNPFPEMNINISLLKLKYFQFDSWNNERSGEVKLHAPSLSSFSFRGYFTNNLTLTNLSSLATAEIRIVSAMPEICPQRVVELLRGIHNVEVLTLEYNFLEALGGPPDVLHTQPTEHFIQHLKLLQTYLSRDCLRSMFFILNNSPYAESISLQISERWVMLNIQFHYDKPPIYPYFNEGKFDPDNIGDYWVARLSLPCRICHLKIAEIKGIHGNANEQKFLELLLKHATVLEKVVLFGSTKQDSETEKRMAEI